MSLAYQRFPPLRFPCVQPLFHETYLQAQNRLKLLVDHYRRCDYAEPVVDDGPPICVIDIRRRLKKLMDEGMRLARVEKDNRFMLLKILTVMRGPGLVDHFHKQALASHTTSLNYVRRKQIIEDINSENRTMIRRILNTKTSYDHVKLELDYQNLKRSRRGRAFVFKKWNAKAEKRRKFIKSGKFLGGTHRHVDTDQLRERTLRTHGNCFQQTQFAPIEPIPVPWASRPCPGAQPVDHLRCFVQLHSLPVSGPPRPAPRVSTEGDFPVRGNRTSKLRAEWLRKGVETPVPRPPSTPRPSPSTPSPLSEPASPCPSPPVPTSSESAPPAPPPSFAPSSFPIPSSDSFPHPHSSPPSSHPSSPPLPPSPPDITSSSPLLDSARPPSPPVESPTPRMPPETCDRPPSPPTSPPFYLATPDQRRRSSSPHPSRPDDFFTPPPGSLPVAAASSPSFDVSQAPPPSPNDFSPHPPLPPPLPIIQQAAEGEDQQQQSEDGEENVNQSSARTLSCFSSGLTGKGRTSPYCRPLLLDRLTTVADTTSQLVQAIRAKGRDREKRVLGTQAYGKNVKRPITRKPVVIPQADDCEEEERKTPSSAFWEKNTERAGRAMKKGQSAVGLQKVKKSVHVGWTAPEGAAGTENTIKDSSCNKCSPGKSFQSRLSKEVQPQTPSKPNRKTVVQSRSYTDSSLKHGPGPSGTPWMTAAGTNAQPSAMGMSGMEARSPATGTPGKKVKSAPVRRHNKSKGRSASRVSAIAGSSRADASAAEVCPPQPSRASWM